MSNKCCNLLVHNHQNGTPRSLCVALDCFSSLFPLTRPAKCSSYAQALLPILVRLTSRQEEALHEALQDAMSKILPTMTPFVTTSNLQVREKVLHNYCHLDLSFSTVGLTLYRFVCCTCRFPTCTCRGSCKCWA